jgi:hypothetical protein
VLADLLAFGAIECLPPRAEFKYPTAVGARKAQKSYDDLMRQTTS